MEREIIINPPDEPETVLGEVTAGIGLITAGIVNGIDLKAWELNILSDDRVRVARELYINKAQLIADGISEKASPKDLYEFLDRTVTSYEITLNAIREHVEDKDRLVDMINRIGVALEGDVNVNQLLTEEAKIELDRLSGRVPKN